MNIRLVEMTKTWVGIPAPAQAKEMAYSDSYSGYFLYPFYHVECRASSFWEEEQFGN